MIDVMGQKVCKLNWSRSSRKRSMVEYPYAIMKRIFHFSHVMVTTIRRVRVKFMFACFAYNVHALKIING